MNPLITKHIVGSLVIIIAFGFFSCKKKEGRLPLITTVNISDIGESAAVGGGVVYFQGDEPVTARGLCWSATSIPTIADEKTNEGGGEGNFASLITGLKPLTRYVVCSYATNKYGTAYGEPLPFTTTAPAPPPTIITSKTKVKSPTEAITGGTVTLPGKAPILAAGVCWNTQPNPNIQQHSKTTDPVTLNTFTSSITGLNANTIYYVRAYATNSTGTSYGGQMQFKTYFSTLTDIDGNTYNTIKIGIQEWTVENLKVSTYRDGTPIDYEPGNSTWSQNPSSGAYSYIDNIFNNWKTYGALYNWNTVSSIHLLAPAGWHIPSRSEYLTMIGVSATNGSYGFKTNAEGLWPNDNSSDNRSGFSAIPGGFRTTNGQYYDKGYSARFWTNTLLTNNPPYSTAYYFHLGTAFYDYSVMSDYTGTGMSVRLVKN